MLVLVVAVAAICVFGARTVRSASAGRFADLSGPTTPYVPLGTVLSSSFSCPGVPAKGDGSDGQLILVNPSDTATTAVVGPLTATGPLAPQTVAVGARASVVVPLGSLAPTGYVAALVETRGSGLVVQQRATLAGTTSVAGCSNETSTDWVLAAGSTSGDREDVILSNPFPDAAVVDLTFVTATDTRAPNEFQTYVIPAGSVRVIALDQIARDEAQLSLIVSARRGRFVAGRAQRFGGTRAGSAVTLGVGSAGRQWLFADGEIGDGIVESYSLVNPSAQATMVDISFFPVTPPAGSIVAPFSVEVPPGRSLQLDPTSLGLGFTGRYAVSIAGEQDQPVIAEHTITRTKLGTSTVTGSQFGSNTWWLPVGVPEATTAALVVFNASGVSGTISVKALGPGGRLPVPGLEAVPVAAAATISVDLPAEVAGLPVVVTGSDNVSLVVEQRLPAGSGRRAGALGIPE